MSHEEICQLLKDAGFDSGWALAADALVLWEHEEDSPAPLVRPEPLEE